MMQVRIGVKRIDPSADKVNDTIHRDDTGMIPCERHRLPAAVAIVPRIVDEMPVDRAAII